jgi:3D (Asp-Asp-Asp) domain-containing protein
MKRLGTTALALAGATLLFACSSSDASEDVGTGASHDELRTASSFTARGTGYYPDGSALEGGFKDRRGKPLHTLQQFLSGEDDYVSVAMDPKAFGYGQRLKIHELETKYGQAITFRVVDTGGAFTGKGRSRVDICTANEHASLDATINGTLNIDVVDETSGGGGGGASSGSSSGGTCRTHGDCNPGYDGSGRICVNGQCVEGCTASWQCPGSASCQAGHCR